MRKERREEEEGGGRVGRGESGRRKGRRERERERGGGKIRFSAESCRSYQSVK